MTTPRHEAEHQLIDNDLSPATQLAGLKLLTQASEANGYLCLSWDEFCQLCGVKTRGAARRHLTRLQAAEIIHYSTNEMVYVTFRTWATRRQRITHAPLADHPRAASGSPQSHPDADLSNTDLTNDPPADHPRAASGAPLPANLTNDPPADHPRAASGSFGHTNRLVGWYITPLPGDLSVKTNQPKPGVSGEPSGPPPLNPEQQRTFRLLRDPEVDVAERNAQRLAREHTFDWCLRQVFAWREELAAGKVSSAGALVNRLEQAYSPGQLTERDRASPLYRRHVSEEEERRRRGDRYTPGEFQDLINS